MLLSSLLSWAREDNFETSWAFEELEEPEGMGGGGGEEELEGVGRSPEVGWGGVRRSWSIGSVSGPGENGEAVCKLRGT